MSTLHGQLRIKSIQLFIIYKFTILNLKIALRTEQKTSQSGAKYPFIDTKVFF